MYINLHDTITAPATPPGTSALSVLRVSGAEAILLVSQLFSKPEKLLSAEGYQAVHGFILEAGLPLDEVICLVFRAPHSYTGEDMVEISGHGNPDISSRLLQLLLTSCRMAEPGEFTLRAFMNHKLDLAQAEAVSDLINAQTSRAEKAALNQLKGSLSSQIRHYIEALTDCRIKFELSIDFADQDLPQMDMSEVQAELETLLDELLALYNSGSRGRILRDGFTVCLAGAPNVGKSSVFNQFLNENRAIVTSTPGTTRDYLEAWINLDGYPIRLIDTAGLRETLDHVEQIGIDRTREIISHADLVINITDSHPSPSPFDSAQGDRMCTGKDISIEHSETNAADSKCQAELSRSLGHDNTINVLNKIDLLGYTEMPSAETWTDPSGLAACIPCSAVLPNGLDALRSAIRAHIALPETEMPSVLVTNTRHLAAIDKAITAIRTALGAITAASGYEFIAFDLIEAVSALSEITGAVTTDDMLERIFSGFCIGK